MKSGAFLKTNTPLIPGKLYRVGGPAWAFRSLEKVWGRFHATVKEIALYKNHRVEDIDILLLEDTPILLLSADIDHVKILVFDRIWHLSTSVLLVPI